MNNTEEKRWCLYCHTNKENNKKYFGITCQKPERRWQNGYGYKTKYFYNAIQKYGWDGFEHQIILTNLSFDEANKKEKEYILLYHTCIYDSECWGYNSTYGGDGCFGYKHTEETKKLFKERFVSEETKRKISKKVSEINRGRIVSEETKRKISESEKGKNISKETREKISKAFKGKVLSEEHRNKISKNHIENHRYNCKKVYQIDKDSRVILNEYFSTGEAERTTGINNIRACCNGKQKTAGGYIWSYYPFD